jgi:copper(I)-binding protein
MIRIAAVILTGLVTLGAAIAAPARSGTAPAATPESAIGTLIAASPLEIVDAVPVSLLIQNDGAADRLLGGSTPYATRVEVQQTRLVDGRRESEILPRGLAIPAGATMLLERGAAHLELRGLKRHLVQGATFPLTLRFERAGAVTVTVRVRRKLDAAGVSPIPPVVAGDLRLSLASAPPAPAGTPVGS